ncbi:NADH-quinone oxidoreductase subunit D [Halapricum desulfuricans]|uniref:NADH dehydrogenase subunit C/D n=1 Tax=Halapricum desulfuricans TaxID=2841257 RepID=A0A897N7N5_9EURY|nr:NADH-quinone oxidoreductase subunit D [Halapricum desulfuricans]QSG08278.1 NADH dehydrogenase subunit C/D [Halapricum desulfuricans]QSG12608.1 NADH dehydrogenase subunit C/D [Halapricum desulfuricans]
MSLEEPEPPTADEVGVTEDGLDYDALEALVSEHVIDRESHVNAEALVIRPDAVQDTLSALKEEAGFDHCSAVTAQEYEDRYESIYHLKKFDDPTQQLSVVVPTSKDEPVSESAEPVFRTADWHEREAYDLVGIEYDDHPDLRRILLPETWQGHPMGKDYNQNQPQVVTLREHVNPLAEDHSAGEDSDTMFVNIGPHHPATHGVLHVKTVLDGEQIVDLDPDIGYLHRNEEQMCEQSTYRHQIMPYPDRWDYTPGGILNEWAYARAAESMADIEVPEYAQVLRTMSAELTRIAAHMLALGTFGLDVYGDFNAIFMYAVRDREAVQNILEDLTGQRLMFNYFRLGGVAWDIPEPREEFFEKTREFLDGLPEYIEEYHNLITENEIFQLRCIDTGVLPPEVAKNYGATGPVLRGSGVDYDLRRDDPYGYYDELDWDVVTEDGCDNYSRVLVRMREVEESAKIIRQCVDLLEDWPEDDREIQANVPRTLRPEAGKEVYEAVEGAKGELGIYMRSDGTDKPARFKIRSPCFSNLQTLPEMSEGEYIPDMVASLGSLDIVLGEVDR